MKKKGLIISTIVMVVVLIASLTTATYAWFNANASVTVKNLSVVTNASSGLQIAIENGSSYYSGDIEYNAGVLTSSQEGFGSYLDFDALDNSGNGAFAGMDASTTWAKFTKLTSITAGSTLPANTYTLKKDGENTIDGDYVLTSGTAVADTDYYSFELASISIGSASTTSLIADGYNCYKNGAELNSSNKPTEYIQVTENTYYMQLNIAVQPTKDCSAIVCLLDATSLKSVTNYTTPGMAAAARVMIHTNAGYYVWAPYNSLNWSTSSDKSANVIESDGQFAFLVANTETAGSIKAGTVYNCYLTIWIEGEDNYNNQSTAGTGFDFEIDFTHSETVLTAETNGTNSGKYKLELTNNNNETDDYYFQSIANLTTTVTA